jgi:hypothetical protein
VTAAETAQLEICADAQHQPCPAAAGMRFFHGQNVIDLNIHILKN